MISTVAFALLAVAPADQRPVLDAIPAEATSALYVERTRGNLEAALDAIDRTLGAEQTAEFLAGAPLPALALKAMTTPDGDDLGLDLERGMALFRVERFTGVVGVVAARDEARAVAALTESLSPLAAHTGVAADGSTRIRLPTGEAVALWVDRGYLYLALPDESALRTPGAEPSGDQNLDALIAELKSARSLSTSAAFRLARARVQEADVYWWGQPPLGPDSPLTGAVVSVRLSENGARFDGFGAARAPLLATPKGDRPPPLLASVPARPTVVVSARAARADVAAFLPFWRESWPAFGAFDDARALLDALDGDFELAFYLDARLSITAAARETSLSAPLGTLLGQARARDVRLARQRTDSFLRKLSLRPASDGSALRFLHQGEPVVLRFERGLVTLEAGPRLSRKRVDARATMAAGLPRGAFGDGHLTAVADFAQMRVEATTPFRGSGLDPAELAAAQESFAGALRDAFPFDRAALDVAPEDGGARLTLQLDYAAPEGPWGER